MAHLKVLPTNYLSTNHIYLYKQDMALNNLQELICHCSFSLSLLHPLPFAFFIFALISLSLSPSLLFSLFPFQSLPFSLLFSFYTCSSLSLFSPFFVLHSLFILMTSTNLNYLSPCHWEGNRIDITIYSPAFSLPSFLLNETFGWDCYLTHW